MHTTNNQAMSGVELTGIMDLDERMVLKINALANAELDDEEEEGPPTDKTVTLSVRDILMAITIPDTDKPLFHMISGASGGSHEGFYPESKEGEDMASQHTASLVMTQLIWTYAIEALDISAYLEVNQSLRDPKSVVGSGL